MKLKQLSVFLQNKPGRLREVCALLAKNQINIVTVSLADTEQFGILRLIVSDSTAAKALLEKEGFMAKVTEVIAVEVSDQPGGLADVLQVEEAAGISVEYIYTLTIKNGKNGVFLIRFDDADKAVAALQASGFNLLDSASLHQLAKG